MTNFPRARRSSVAVGCALTATTLLAAPSGAAVAAPVTTAAVATSAPGTVLAVAGASSAQLVGAWYSTFLGRSADGDAGAGYWTGRLDAGQDPEDVLADLLRSPEYVQRSVRAIYRGYIDRNPDVGAGYWVSGVEDGRFPLEWVEQNVASSPEYLSRTGADRGRGDVAVEGWYSVVLDRSPSLGERDHWTGRLRQVGALAALRELWYSPEAVARRVQLHYRGLLDRTASAGEVGYWYAAEVRSDIAVVEAIASSPEYARRAAG